MKKLLHEVLSLSALERKGVLLLIILMLLITGINAFLIRHPSSGDKKIDATLLKELQAFEQQLTPRTEGSVNTPPANENSITEPMELFSFDPNKASAGDLQRLGLSSRLIRTLINYRLHGGRFYKKEDLNRIYGMDPFVYERLYPYITIGETESSVSSGKAFVPEIVRAPVNLNMADSAVLEGLRGIGPLLARRIVRYRTLLGGFYDTGQLKEVYGISDSLLLVIKTGVFADTAAIHKLNINLASEGELARHPYIGKYVAKGIVSYRLKVQKIDHLDELIIIGLLSSENLEKLKNYLMI